MVRNRLLVPTLLKTNYKRERHPWPLVLTTPVVTGSTCWPQKTPDSISFHDGIFVGTSFVFAAGIAALSVWHIYSRREQRSWPRFYRQVAILARRKSRMSRELRETWWWNRGSNRGWTTEAGVETESTGCESTRFRTGVQLSFRRIIIVFITK